MTTYVTLTAIWRKGVEVPVGTELTLSKAESKYLKHALRETKVEAPAPVVEPVTDENSGTDSEDLKTAKRAKVRRDGHELG